MKNLTIITGLTGVGKTTRLKEIISKTQDVIFLVDPYPELPENPEQVKKFKDLKELKEFLKNSEINISEISLFIDEFCQLEKDFDANLLFGFKEATISKQGTFDYGLDLYRKLRRKHLFENTEVSIIELKRNW